MGGIQGQAYPLPGQGIQAKKGRRHQGGHGQGQPDGRHRDATEGEGQPNPAHGDHRGHEELQREGCHWPGPCLQAAPRYQGEEEARRGSRRYYRREEKVKSKSFPSCYVVIPSPSTKISKYMKNVRPKKKKKKKKKKYLR